MKKYLFILLVLCSKISLAQNDSISKNKFYIPKNIEECNYELDKAFSNKAKSELKKLEDRLVKRILGVYTINEWFDHDSTRLALYFKKHSIFDWQERDFLILLSYKRYLEKKPFDFEQECQIIISQKMALEKKQKQEYEKNIVADSINKVFIPTDINSCLAELDRLLSDTTKQEIKKNSSESELAAYHMGLGRWMRNNWNLWGGSRLKLYFIEKGFTNPDHMSGIILEAYYDHLNNNYTDTQNYINKAIKEQKEFEEMIANSPTFTCDYSAEDYYTDEYKKFLKKGK